MWIDLGNCHEGSHVNYPTPRDVSKGRYATPVPPDMHQNVQALPVRCIFCSSYSGVHIDTWSGISAERDLGFRVTCRHNKSDLI